MGGLVLFQFHLLPFLEACIAPKLVTVLLWAAILRLREHGKVDRHDHRKYPASKSPYCHEDYSPTLTFPIIGNFPLLQGLFTKWDCVRNLETFSNLWGQPNL